MPLVKRLTLIMRDGRMEEVFYPVFPLTRAPIKCWAGSGITQSNLNLHRSGVSADAPFCLIVSLP